MLISLGRRICPSRRNWSFDEDNFRIFLTREIPLCYANEIDELATLLSSAANAGNRPSVLLRCPDGAPSLEIARTIASCISSGWDKQTIEVDHITNPINLMGSSRNFRDSQAGTIARRAATLGDVPIIVNHADSLKNLYEGDGDPVNFLRSLASDGIVADQFIGAPVELCNPLIIIESTNEPISIFSGARSVEISIHKTSRDEKTELIRSLLDVIAPTYEQEVPGYIADRYCLDDGVSGITNSISIIERSLEKGVETFLSVDYIRKILPEPNPEDYRTWIGLKRQSLACAPEAVARRADELLAKIALKDTDLPIAKAKLRLLLRALPPYDKKLPRIEAEEFKEIISQSHPEIYGIDKLASALSTSLAGNTHIQAFILAGPAGIGKTTLPKALANKIGVPFNKFEMQSIHNDDLFGTAAYPGYITNAIADLDGDPGIIVLDEIDKTTSTQALCSLLDSGTLSDFYIGSPINLAQNLIIMTANDLDRVSPYIINRCTVVELLGYTHAQKVTIAKRVLLDEIFQEFGLSPIPVSDEALRYVATQNDEVGLRKFQEKLRVLIANHTGDTEIDLAEAELLFPQEQATHHGLKTILPRTGPKGGVALASISAIQRPANMDNTRSRGISCVSPADPVFIASLTSVESAMAFASACKRDSCDTQWNRQP